jgi:hypothetical protein
MKGFHERIILHAVEAGRASEKNAKIGMAADGLPGTSWWEPAWRLLPELPRRYEPVDTCAMRKLRKIEMSLIPGEGGTH